MPNDMISKRIRYKQNRPCGIPECHRQPFEHQPWTEKEQLQKPDSSALQSMKMIA